MSRFVPDRQTFFETIYREQAPWDIGGPQPAFQELFDELPIESPVLDLGCGTGDLAIEIGRRGHEVLGIDSVPAAIAEANARARKAGFDETGPVTFQVADALHPSALGRDFRTVVDSGFYHIFDQAQRNTLAEELAGIIPRGGRFYLLAFAVEFPHPNTPLRVTPEEIVLRFREEVGWKILISRPSAFESTIAPVPAIAVCVERI